MPITVDQISLTIGLISTVAAVVTVIFAWRAVKLAEKTNTLGLIVEIHKIYHSETTYEAIKTIWALYSKYQEKPITHQQAVQFVNEIDKSSLEWKAVHDMSLMWRYLHLLIRVGFIDETLAYESFTSPGMLGFLYPVEKAYLELLGYNYEHDKSLHGLYDRWKSSKSKTL